VKSLKEMFRGLNIVTTKEDVKDKETLLKESLLRKYDLVVITECLDLNQIYKLDELIRTQKRPIGLIYG
jgi:hypothetical protein